MYRNTINETVVFALANLNIDDAITADVVEPSSLLGKLLTLAACVDLWRLGRATSCDVVDAIKAMDGLHAAAEDEGDVLCVWVWPGENLRLPDGTTTQDDANDDAMILTVQDGELVCGEIHCTPRSIDADGVIGQLSSAAKNWLRRLEDTYEKAMEEMVEADSDEEDVLLIEDVLGWTLHREEHVEGEVTSPTSCNIWLKNGVSGGVTITITDPSERLVKLASVEDGDGLEPQGSYAWDDVTMRQINACLGVADDSAQRRPR